MRFILCLSLALAALGPGPLGAQVSPNGAGATSTMALIPGDVVRIMVWRKPELSGEFTVAGDGTISSPFYMDVRVGGIPITSATELVRAHVARYESEPRVLVEPLLRVSIGGEVRQPNVYSFGVETTIAQAIMHAGGTTERGNVSRVLMWRDGQELMVDLTRPDLGLAGSPIRSGDQILVPRQRSILRDYIAPASSVVGAAIAVTNILLRRL